MLQRAKARSAILSSCTGIAAVEFALTLPILLQMFGIIDFAGAAWSKAILAQSVAAGAQYAALKGTSVTQSMVQAVVGQRLSIPAANITMSAPACSCLSSSPAALSAHACSSMCPDGTAPGTYVTIAATYTYQPVLSLWDYVGTPVMRETVTSRIQ